MARMTIPHVFGDSFLQLLQGPRLRRLGEQRPVNFLGRVAAGAAEHDLVFLRVPFQQGAGPMPSLRRTSAGTEIWPWAVSIEQAIRIPNIYHGNRNSKCGTL